MAFTITYAGHSAVFLEIGGKKIAIDPWLQGNPLCPEKLKNPGALDLIVLTHGHADHASDVPRLAKESGARVCATYELAMILVREGVPEDKIVPMNKGGGVFFDDVQCVLTHALHSSSYDSPQRGTLYAGEACGVVIRWQDQAIYHAGDTCLFSDMKFIGELYPLTLALLPIGDHFTMGPVEAAQAAQLLRAKLVAPIHYKTFPLLTGSYAEFQEQCRSREVESCELEIGKLVRF